MVRADAVRWPRVFQRFALTQVAGLGFAAAPGTEDLHLADVTLPMPCHPYWPRDCDARDRVIKLHLCTGGGNGRDRLQTYQTQRASAPNPASDHMRIAAHSSRASATKIAVISAPMILAITVPSSVRAGRQRGCQKPVASKFAVLRVTHDCPRCPRRATCPVSGKTARP